MDDTFESISRRTYGTETEADHLLKSNPGVQEPLTAGTEIVAPVVPTYPDDLPSEINAEGDSDVAVLINGKRLRVWESVRIIRGMDLIDTVELTAPMESKLPQFKETFKPFSYFPVSVYVAGETLFRGTQTNVVPVITPDEKVVSLSAYSICGTMNDCSPSANVYPIEFNGQGLREIATTLARPFGIGVQFDADPGPAFDRVAMSPNASPLSFLIELAKQNGLLITNTKRGDLRFYKPNTGTQPVAILEQGQPPLPTVRPFFSPQAYYSHITGIKPVEVGSEGSQVTLKNPHLTGVLRPHTFVVTDTSDGAVTAAVEAKRGRMYGSMVMYSIDVPTWRDVDGDLWEPGTVIRLEARDAMINSSYKFMIKTVELSRDQDSEQATLNLVIPESFTGETPESMPWD